MSPGRQKRPRPKHIAKRAVARRHSLVHAQHVGFLCVDPPPGLNKSRLYSASVLLIDDIYAIF